MIRFFLLLNLLILSQLAFAQQVIPAQPNQPATNTPSQNVQGILTAESNEGILTVKEGDTFIANFVIWPISYIGSGEFEKNYSNKAFLDYFHITEVINEGYSDNNPDAYNIRLRLVLVKFFDNRNFLIWPFRGLNIPVTIKNINPASLDGRNKDMVLLQQDYTFSTNRGFYIFVVFLIVIIFIAAKYIPKHLEKKRKEKELQEFKNSWREKFQKAEQRTDYEFLYSSREAWLKLLPMQTPQLIEFFEVINNHQYKKDWNEDEFEEVANSFKNIRDIIN